MLTSLTQDWKETFPWTLFADTSQVIFKVACAWLGCPQPFRQMLHISAYCCPSSCWNNCCLDNWGAVLGVQQSNTLARPGGMRFLFTCVPQTITHTYIHGSNPYSIKISPAVLYFLEASLNIPEGWILPHLDAEGHQTPRGTHMVVACKVFASWNWRQLGEV